MKNEKETYIFLVDLLSLFGSSFRTLAVILFQIFDFLIITITITCITMHHHLYFYQHHSHFRSSSVLRHNEWNPVYLNCLSLLRSAKISPPPIPAALHLMHRRMILS